MPALARSEPILLKESCHGEVRASSKAQAPFGVAKFGLVTDKAEDLLDVASCLIVALSAWVLRWEASLSDYPWRRDTLRPRLDGRHNLLFSGPAGMPGFFCARCKVIDSSKGRTAVGFFPSVSSRFDDANGRCGVKLLKCRHRSCPEMGDSILNLTVGGADWGYF